MIASNEGVHIRVNQYVCVCMYLFAQEVGLEATSVADDATYKHKLFAGAKLQTDNLTIFC